MKYFLFLLGLVVFSILSSYGQSITFTFSGKSNLDGSDMPVDSVKIVNVTNGTDTLVVGNTFFIVITSLDITETDKPGKIEAYPNPFHNQSTIKIHSKYDQAINLAAYSLDGRLLAESNYWLKVGENEFVLRSGVEGALIVDVRSADERWQGKLFCLSKNGSTGFSQSFFTNETSEDRLKSTNGLSEEFSFHLGDSLSFIGYSGDNLTDTIGDSPNGNMDYVFVFDGTGNVPVADFSVSDFQPDPGTSIDFFDQSINSPSSWQWDFGDGETGSDQNPSHVYSQPGTYTVTLIATNDFGSDTLVKQDYIFVPGSVPVANFAADKTTVNKGEEISFTDRSTNSPTAWIWDFGDGSTSDLQHPKHSYSSTGFYTITLVAINEIGSDTLIKVDFIEVNPLNPVADFAADRTTINQGEKINFTDHSTNSPGAWAWDFGDGATSDEQNPAHTYSAPGTYSVTLIVTNASGSDSLTKENYIVVSSMVPLAGFTASSTTGNPGTEISFTDQSTNSPNSWQWNFGDGSTSNAQNPSHTYNSAGSFTVSLIVSNSYGADTLVKTDYIEIIAAQIPVLSVSPTVLDFGSTDSQKTVAIQNSGSGTLNWSVSENIDWLSVSPQSGETTSETDQITVAVNRSGLSAGSYSGQITVSGNGGSIVVAVSVDVQEQVKNSPAKPGWQ